MNEDLTEVHRADDARYRAMLDGDLSALERLLASQLSYSHSSAHRENKREYLASLASGRVRYLDAQRDGVTAQIHGDTAVLEGHVVLQAIVDGESRRLDNRFLSVWLREGGAWQMLAWASTPIPPKN
ncbi:MAG: nuclear transport factor 2 family protein [Cupriavidus necator]